MPLPPLATTADLTARKITGPGPLAAFLGAASAEVRDAAGAPIVRTTFTAAVPGTRDQWLSLPGQPIVTVTGVELDGDPVPESPTGDGWRKVGGRLWRRRGWQADPWTPSEVTATITGGLEEVPADIVDLVCSMVGAALARMAEGDGYATRGDLAAVQVDDYQERYQADGAERLAGVMELPQRTRDRLASRFGGGAHVIGASE